MKLSLSVGTAPHEGRVSHGVYNISVWQSNEVGIYMCMAKRVTPAIVSWRMWPGFYVISVCLSKYP